MSFFARKGVASLGLFCYVIAIVRPCQQISEQCLMFCLFWSLDVQMHEYLYWDQLEIYV